MGIEIKITRDTAVEALDDIKQLALAMGWAESRFTTLGRIESLGVLEPAETVEVGPEVVEAPATAAPRTRKPKLVAPPVEVAVEVAPSVAPVESEPAVEQTTAAEMKRIAGDTAAIVPPPATVAAEPEANLDEDLDDGLGDATYTKDDLKALLTEIKASPDGKRKVVQILTHFNAVNFTGLPEGQATACYLYAKTVV